MKEIKNRKSGILLHPTALPSGYGIGDFGNTAYEFVDFLKDSAQKLWQILPLGPTGYSNSPYQSYSAFAGQPLLISPDKLRDIGLLTDEDLQIKPSFNLYRVQYDRVQAYKDTLFKIAYTRFNQTTDVQLLDAFDDFCEKEGDWLNDYALFIAAYEYYDFSEWTNWEEGLSLGKEDSKTLWSEKLADEIKYHKFLQFIFFKQWFDLKSYANDRNIQIIGDIPIFVAYSSADVWANKDLFLLDPDGTPTVVAGVPPDYFSAEGQLWGNPLYNWKVHKKSNYAWWLKRFNHNLKMVDIIRVDHFRGFDSYWAVPYGSENAINGKWKKGPKASFFKALTKAFGNDLPIIAEDLGIITPEVTALKDEFGLPGMNVLQFAFDGLEDNNYLPHNHVPNSVTYTGTHDNNTSLGWYLSATEKERDLVRRYMNTDGMDICWDFIRTCLASVSYYAIMPLQDILGLGADARMNVPGESTGQWEFRYDPSTINDYVSTRLSTLTALFGR
jgi:4-alpha-glucanotransferase